MNELRTPCQVRLDPLEREPRDAVAVLEPIQKDQVVDSVEGGAEIEKAEQPIAAEIASPLAFIFEQFFSDAFVPPIWEEAYIRPIFKEGSACDPANYRPISLTCECSKIMESIISEHMLSFLLAHDLITKHQHGFLVKRSTCTQLLECFQDWVVSLNNKRSVDIVYIDFSRAFDSVVYSKQFIK